MNTSSTKKTVMIVDDEPENLNVLSGLLSSTDWDVCAFPRGEPALAAAQEQPPDIILLDILMPGLDGYETCRRLKKNPQTCTIPVLFLSALSDPNAKVTAFKAGGVDYITKPFQEDEVLARIRTHLELHEHRQHLESLVMKRSQELAKVHGRLRIWDDAKDQWLNLLSHEMRTPLTGIFGTAEFLFTMADPNNPDLRELRNGYDISVRRIGKLIDDAMLLTQIDVTSENFATQKIVCTPLLNQAVSQLLCRYPEIQLTTDYTSCSPVKVAVDSELLLRAFSDLLFTATCCVTDHEKIEVRAAVQTDYFTITISTDGKSLPESSLLTFFNVGGQRTLLKGGGDFGLSPVLARKIIELFSGTCTIRNGNPCGLVMQIQIPLAPPITLE